jgi:hypothetical protein
MCIVRFVRQVVSSAPLLSGVLLLAACGGATPPPQTAAPPTSRAVFEATAPSVVAVLNDDRADREREMQEMEKALGDESHAPKHVVDISARKEPDPHGTGFAVLDPQSHAVVILTAAHVVLRPDRLKLTSRGGQTVDGEIVAIDEVRDVAIIRPRQPLTGVPALELADKDPDVGSPVWAMGRFSGGPVVTIDAQGKPRVVGLNHAILFTAETEYSPLGPISSAVCISEIRAAMAGAEAPVVAKMATYAKEQRAKQWADVFVTDKLAVSRDDEDQPVAYLAGNARSVDVEDDGRVHIPAVAMVFGLPTGSQEVTFEVDDVNEATIATETAPVRVAEGQRVAFASASVSFVTKSHGKHSVIAKVGDKELGRAFVNLLLPDDDEDLDDEHDGDSSDDGNPDVDVVVAALGHDDPLALLGIRAAWSERTYPRRVAYTWFARATRGWSGTNVSISSYVLDSSGKVVGRNEGCFQGEVRPEHPWSCMGAGSDTSSPLAAKEGPYDIVFAINDRPVAWWPMEAVVRQEHAPGSDLQRWLKDVQRAATKRKRTNPPPAPPPPPAPTPKTPKH